MFHDAVRGTSDDWDAKYVRGRYGRLRCATCYVLHETVDFTAYSSYITANILPVRKRGWAQEVRGWYPD